MSSCLLFHGPGAKLAACEAAARLGFLLADPFGDDEGGLKVDDARAACALLSTTPLGDQIGVVVIGPMDGTATLKSADVLLKSIEEFRGEFVQPVLWAHDLGGVPMTIRSRCLAHWSDLEEAKDEDDDEVASSAWTAVSAAIQKDHARLIGALRLLTRKEAKANKFLMALVDCLSTKLDDPAHRAVWERLRPVALRRVIVPLDLASALMGD